MTMTDAEILAALGPVQFEPSCVVPDDDSEVVRHAWQPDPQAIAKLREQAIARLAYDPIAVAARERRLALERGRVAILRRRA